jgi:hypothetical protein
MLRPFHAQLVKTFEILLGDGWYGSAFFCRLDEDSEGLQSAKLLIRHLGHQLKEVRRTRRLGFFRRFSHDPGSGLAEVLAVLGLLRSLLWPRFGSLFNLIGLSQRFVGFCSLL